MKSTMAKFFSSLLLVLAMTAGAHNAWAATAANTQITNRATLTYAGGQAFAQVTVTVALVNSQASITITGAGPVGWTGPNSPTQVDNVVVTATANGPASYTITPSITGQTNNGNSGSFTINGGATQTVTLGASVITSSTAHSSDLNNLVIPTPAGYVAGTANGISSGTALIWTVGITTYTATVNTVTDNGDGTVTLNLTAAIGAAPPVGTPIFEYRNLPVIVSPGSPVAAGTPITVTVSATVANGGANPINTVPAPGVNTWNTSSGLGSLKKYVRNLTTAAGNTAGTNAKSFSVDGRPAVNYFDGGVTGVKDDILEYVLEATDTSATEAVTSAVITDVVPTNYVAYQTNIYTTGTAASKDVWYRADTGATETLVKTLGGANNDTLTVAVGGVAPVAPTGGTIPASGFCLVAYQVKIK